MGGWVVGWLGRVLYSKWVWGWKKGGRNIYTVASRCDWHRARDS